MWHSWWQQGCCSHRCKIFSKLDSSFFGRMRAPYDRSWEQCLECYRVLHRTCCHLGAGDSVVVVTLVGETACASCVSCAALSSFGPSGGASRSEPPGCVWIIG